MFEGLDDIPWDELEHAYGRASVVPSLIRGMVSLDADERARAVDGFWGGPLHQGSIYTSSLAAVPFLIESLVVRHADRDQLLQMLAAIGVGWVENLAGRPRTLAHVNPGHPRDISFGRRQLDYDDQALTRDCYLAVAEGCERYLLLVADAENPDVVRSYAANLLAWFPPAAYDARPVLRELFEDPGASDTLRASAALALAHLGAPVPFDIHSSPVLDAAVRIGAALHRSPEDRRVLLGPLMQRPLPEPEDRWPWGRLSDIVERLGAATTQLLAEYEEAPSETLRTILMDRLFPPDRHPATNVRTAIRQFPDHEVSGWSSEARTFLRLLAGQPELWPAVAELLRERLGLMFDPTRDELTEALEREAPRRGPFRPERQLSESEIPGLMAALSEAGSLAACDALGSLRDVAQVPAPLVAPLLELALGADSVIASGAAWVLRRAQLQSPEADRVLQRVQQDPEANVHLADLVEALGPAHFERTIALVRDLLDGASAALAYELFPAVEAAGQEPMMRALGDPHPGVRAHACDAFQDFFRDGEVGDPRALDALLSRCEDVDENVRERAAMALEHAGAGVVPLLDPTAGRSAADLIRLLVGLRTHVEQPRAAAMVVRQLEHPDWRVRMACVDALGQGPPTTECLQGMAIALRDEHPGPRELAAAALGRYGTEAMSLAPAIVEAELPLTLALRVLARMRSFAPAERFLRILGDSALDDEVRRELHLTLHALMPDSLPLALSLLNSATDVTPVQLWALEPAAPLDHPRLSELAREASPTGAIARWLCSGG